MNIRIEKHPPPTFTPDLIINNIAERIGHADYVDGGYPVYGREFINSINEAAKALWDTGAKIKTIKFIRNIFPMDLRQTKEYCESKFN